VSLPEGWVETTLGEVIPNYAKNKKINSNELLDGTWVLELEDIEKHSSKLLKKVMYSERQSKSTKNIFDKGDVLYGKLRPYLNKVIIADSSGVCTTEIIPIKENEKVISKYLFYVLKSSAFLKYVEFSTHGLNMPRLGTASAKKAPFPLAPLKEQKQIAQKLDQVLARVERIKMALDNIPATIKRFRQSVLALATSGGLSEEGVKWETLRVNDVAKVGTGKTPLKSETSFYENGTVPWLTSSVTGKDFVIDTDSYVTQKAVDECKLRIFDKGTLLVAMYGEGKTRGQTTELTFPATINQACAAIMVDEEKIDKAYLKIRLLENYMETRRLAEGGNQPNLNLSKVRSITVPTPPREEQKAIVKKVETLFTLADNLEKRVNQAQKQVDRLTQSILAKAFRGELIDEDSIYEPVSIEN